MEEAVLGRRHHLEGQLLGQMRRQIEVDDSEVDDILFG